MWRCPLIAYAERLSLSSEKLYLMSGLRPAPETPDLESLMISVEFMMFACMAGASPSIVPVG